MPESQKHGPFALRYPLIRRKPSPPSVWRPSEWEGFLARFYPSCRRHDFDALAAYEAYRNDLSGRHPGGSPTPGSLPGAVHAAWSDKAQRGEHKEEPRRLRKPSGGKVRAPR